MRVEDLINELEDMLNDAKVLPLTGGKAVIDTETALDILDEIQDSLPSEIRQAKAVVADRNQIIAEAKKEAEDIVRKGEEKRKELVEESEVVKQAEAHAEEILQNAKHQSAKIKRATNDYVEGLFKNTDETLTVMLDEIRKNRQSLHNSKTAKQARAATDGNEND